MGYDLDEKMDAVTEAIWRQLGDQNYWPPVKTNLQMARDYYMTQDDLAAFLSRVRARLAEHYVFNFDGEFVRGALNLDTIGLVARVYAHTTSVPAAVARQP